jgi:biotin carboxyl carrier protein
LKQFLLQKSNGEEIKVVLKPKGSGVEVTLGEKIFLFSKEELKNSGITSEWAGGQIFISSPMLQRAFDFSPSAKASGSPLSGQGQSQLKALFPGKIVKILAKENSWAEEGELLLVMESMKMEYNYKAPKKTKIEKILVQEGQVLSKGDEFFQIKKD